MKALARTCYESEVLQGLRGAQRYQQVTVSAASRV
jgi:hypothetical protein